MSLDPCRTRFAPSPTGSLHVGGVRTALYCLLWARKTGGSFLLRIEDTDQVRSSESAARGIVDDMRWLGLDWDEGPEVGGPVGPYFQSERLAHYDAVVDRLLDEGKAYLAWDSPEELAAMRDEAEREKRTFRYRRHPVSDAQLLAYEAEGRRPVVRLVAPDHGITVDDAILGSIRQEAEELDDLVLRKADGFPTYHLAVVVDDEMMGIDLILRGQDHVMNTHKHRAIQEALGWREIPTGHLPLIFNPRGSKMSKRDKAKAARRAAREASKSHGAGWDWLAARARRGVAEVELFMEKQTDELVLAEAIAGALSVELPLVEVMDFRRGGYVPEAVLNYMALLGWNPGDDREILSVDEMIDAFQLDRVSRQPARFDQDKLKWLNGEYLRNLLTTERIAALLDQWLAVFPSPIAELDPDRRMALFLMYRARVQTFAELHAASSFFFARPEQYDADAVDKHLRTGDGLARLKQLRAVLADVGRWEVGSLERAIVAFGDQVGAKLGKLAQPLRIAVSGTAVTPSIFDVLAFLGRDEVLARVDACVAALSDG